MRAKSLPKHGTKCWLIMSNGSSGSLNDTSQSSCPTFNYGFEISQTNVEIDKSIAIAGAQLGTLRAFIDTEIDRYIKDAGNALLSCQDCANQAIDKLIGEAGGIASLVSSLIDRAIQSAISEAGEYYAGLPYSPVQINQSETTIVEQEPPQTVPVIPTTQKQVLTQKQLDEITKYVEEFKKFKQETNDKLDQVITGKAAAITPITGGTQPLVQPDLGTMGNLLFNVQSSDEVDRLAAYYGDWMRQLLEADSIDTLKALNTTPDFSGELQPEELSK